MELVRIFIEVVHMCEQVRSGVYIYIYIFIQNIYIYTCDAYISISTVFICRNGAYGFRSSAYI